MFDSFDRDRDGRIDATELGSALRHYQYANFSTISSSFTNEYSSQNTCWPPNPRHVSEEIR
jgi:Ca2+-binding EF-hand superfamily protein